MDDDEGGALLGACVPGSIHPATPTICPVGLYIALIQVTSGRWREALRRVPRRLARVATSPSRVAGGSIRSQKDSGKHMYRYSPYLNCKFSW